MFRAGCLNQQVRTEVLPIELIASSHTTVADPGASIGVSKPTGTAEGDLVVFFLQTRNSTVTSGTPAANATELCNWDVNGSTVADSETTNERFLIWALWAGASEPGNYTIALNASATDGATLVAVTYRNVGAIDFGGHTADAIVTGPTADVGDVVLSWMGTSFDVTTSWGPPSGFTTIQNNYEAVTDVGGHLAYKEIVSQGAVGSIDWITALDYSMGCYVHLIANPTPVSATVLMKSAVAVNDATSGVTLTNLGSVTENTDGFASGIPDFTFTRAAAEGIGIDDDAVLDIGTGDFTVEAWVNTTQGLVSSQAATLWANDRLAANGVGNPRVIMLATNPIAAFYNGAYRIYGTTTINDGVWHHIALVRVSGVYKLFIDGEQEGGDYSDSTSYSTTGMGIFDWSTNGSIDGDVAQWRLVVGTALYTKNFLPSLDLDG